MQVRATDLDVDRRSPIRYAVTGQFADDGTFIINSHTGEVYVTRGLDRDPPRGRPVWNFNVLAHDEGDDGGRTVSGQPSLTGYAEVRVIPRDVNDNPPVFDRNRLVGKVPEHSRPGASLSSIFFLGLAVNCATNIEPVRDHMTTALLLNNAILIAITRFILSTELLRLLVVFLTLYC